MTFLPNTRSSPAFYPMQFNVRSRAVRWIGLTEARYKTSSFLDERLLQGAPLPPWEPWATAQLAAHGVEKTCNFIFHIGHVGSTLLSRLLDEHPASMALREPPVLRTLAQSYFTLSAREDMQERTALNHQIDVFGRIFSRTWRHDQTAVIKATSFVSGMAAYLLHHMPSTRAIFLTVTPMAYLRGILGGAARAEIPLMAPSRIERLNRRLGVTWTLEGMSEGESIAMSWLCEIIALHDASRVRRQDVLWFDFDQVLEAPQTALGAAFTHFGWAADRKLIADITNGPILTQYSKASEHAYDAEARRAVLLQADYEHGAEVRKGMDWLSDRSRAFPAVMEALIATSKISCRSTLVNSAAST